MKSITLALALPTSRFTAVGADMVTGADKRADMKITWFRSLMVLVAIAAIVVVSVLLLLAQPVFGQMPQGERLTLIERSPKPVDARSRTWSTRRSDRGATQLSIRSTICAPRRAIRGRRMTFPSGRRLKLLDVNEDLVMWLGHSSWYVQTGGQRILIDPGSAPKRRRCRASSRRSP